MLFIKDPPSLYLYGFQKTFNMDLAELIKNQRMNDTIDPESENVCHS